MKVKVKSLSRVRLVTTPWTVAFQAPLSMGFSRQEYWSGLPFPLPGELPDPGIEPGSPALEANALTSEPPGKPLLLRLLLNRFSHVRLCAAPETAAHQAPLSLGLSRQEHCLKSSTNGDSTQCRAHKRYINTRWTAPASNLCILWARKR